MLRGGRARPDRSRARACAVVVAALAVAALAGCGGQSDDASPASLRDLVVSPDGLPGLTVGKPVTATDLVAFGEHACPSSGGWLPRYAQDENNSSGQPLHPFDVVTAKSSRSGALAAVFVWSRAVATAKGIHVGSSLAAVQAAYPTAALATGYSTVMYVVPGTTGKLVIELAGHNDDAQGEWSAKLLDTVVWMDVIPKAAKVESIAGSNDAGACPVKGHVPDVDGDGDDD